MMDDNTEMVELGVLVLKLLDGQLSEAGLAELNQALAEDEAFAQYYVKLMLINGYLNKNGSQDVTGADDSPEEDSDRFELLRKVIEYDESVQARWDAEAHERFALEVKRQAEAKLQQFLEKERRRAEEALMARRREQRGVMWRPTRRAVKCAISLAALFLVGFLGYQMWFMPEESPVLEPSGPQVVARLVETVDAGCLGNGEAPAKGDALYAGPLTLRSGLAKVAFESGAETILEGPFSCELISAGRMVMRQGKMTALVPRRGIGFSVQTPSSCVVDLGTEFGLDVDDGGDTDVHVFQGGVALMRGAADQAQPQSDKVLLGAGQARRIQWDGVNATVEKISADQWQFVREQEFDLRVKAQAGSGFDRWLAYSYQLRRDPALVAYYTFERAEGRQLSNQALSTQGRLQGQLGVGGDQKSVPTWTRGRFPGKAALQFDRNRQQGVVVPHDPVLNIEGPMTVAVWVRRTQGDIGGHILRKGNTVQGLNYQFSWFGQVEGVEADSSHKMQWQRSPDQVAGYSKPLGRANTNWTHLAATDDGRNICFYFNGQLVDTLAAGSPPPPNEEPLTIAAMLVDVNPRLWNGLIDEIAILRRAMSGAEIKAMYEAGRPTEN